MNTQSNAMRESSFDSQGIAPAALSATRPMYWCVRRELWENRSIYVAPLAATGVFLFGFLISTVHLPGKVRALSTLDSAQQADAVMMPYLFAAGIMMAAQIIVGVFYSLDALHGERRDRSILFWKSLPVSDLTTVFSKAIIPIVILPLLAFVLTVALQLIMLLLSSTVLLASGVGLTAWWTQLSLLSMWLMLFSHLIMGHGLWHAPIYAWMLLVSGWARRLAFLWAVLPVLAICVLEKLVFNSAHFASWLGYRLRGPEVFDFSMHGNFAMHTLMHADLGKFLSTPGLWTGLAVTAAFLIAAARVRRYRGPI
jgi:ABC-2 type transport system permease protein